MCSMHRYMIHLQNSSFAPKDATLLLYKAREFVQDQEVIVRDARVSRKYIEFDASIPDGTSISNIIRRLEAISPIASYEQIVEHHMEKEQAIKNAVQLFNDEKYWGAHEVLESVWKTSRGNEKRLLNGMILIAAAFVHDEKDESEICLSILQRAMIKFEGAKGNYHGIDIDRAVNLTSRIIDSGKIERFTL
jgi:hypothetical protein